MIVRSRTRWLPAWLLLTSAACGVRSGELLEVETAGLVGHWRLDEGRGARTAEATGRSAAGMLGGHPGWTTSGFPGARFADPFCLAFDGQSDHVRVPRGTALEPEAVTASIWVRRDGAQVAWATALAKTWHNNQAPSYDSYSFQLGPSPEHDSSVVAFETGHPDDVDVLASPPGVLPAGVWVNVVGVYDPKGTAPQKRLYVNGTLRASRGITAPLVYDVSADSDLYFGQIGGCLQFFRGQIDDVRVYDRALEDGEIAAIAAGS